MIAFWAQSLDNESPNLMAVDGRILAPSEEETRQRIISDVYDIVSEKTKVRTTPNAIIYRKGSRFVIEAVPLERDNADRLSPIIATGDFPSNHELSVGWSSAIRTKIEEFASGEAGRTLATRTLEDVEEWLDEQAEQKKRRVSIQGKVALLMAGVGLPIIVGWLLQMQAPQLSPIKVALVLSAGNFSAMLIAFVVAWRRK